LATNTRVEIESPLIRLGETLLLGFSLLVMGRDSRLWVELIRFED